MKKIIELLMENIYEIIIYFKFKFCFIRLFANIRISIIENGIIYIQLMQLNVIFNCIIYLVFNNLFSNDLTIKLIHSIYFLFKTNSISL